ncbi:hypothetical protein Lalb_Chr03g0040141 [Lupinus albus]|uniref:Uncharacterized protein n=1 Tax=Lupinus albus TaxID=3870 RepID=A0A6A4QTY9_LUPAL|nr:hypothetical protein Lalb_Chr03g0040141 [Lupinus albus]
MDGQHSVRGIRSLMHALAHLVRVSGFAAFCVLVQSLMHYSLTINLGLLVQHYPTGIMINISVRTY